MVEPVEPIVPLINLPSRPAQSKDAASIGSINLRSNHFELVVKGSKKNSIFTYSYSFEPEIPLDQRRRRYSILDAIKGDLEKDLGKFLVSGWMIFSSIKKEDPIFKQIKKESIKGNSKEEKDITVKILLAEERDIGSISSLKKEPFLKFFNVLIKKSLKALKFMEIGKNSEFYDRNKSVFIEEHGLEVWKGFKTATDVYKTGLYTLIDFSSRILRMESVNDFIRRCLQEGWKKTDIRDELIGTSCHSYYGNFAMWRIDDIVWDKTPSSKFNKESSEILTFIDYFKQRYNIKITDIKQPLIYHKHKRT